MIRANVEVLIDAVARGPDHLADRECDVGLFVLAVAERAGAEVAPQVGAAVARGFDEVGLEHSQLLSDDAAGFVGRRTPVRVVFRAELEARV